MGGMEETRRGTWGDTGWGQGWTLGEDMGGTLRSAWGLWGDREGHGRDTQSTIKRHGGTLRGATRDQGGTFGGDTRSDTGRNIRGQGGTFGGDTRSNTGRNTRGQGGTLGRTLGGQRRDTREDTGGDTKEKRGSTGLKTGSAAVPHSPMPLPASSILFAPHQVLWGYQLSPRMCVAGFTNNRLSPFWGDDDDNSS